MEISFFVLGSNPGLGIEFRTQKLFRHKKFITWCVGTLCNAGVLVYLTNCVT
ncbi:hypothetical protein LPICM17_70039 [Lactococcus piscium]|nr:hypothetical protein LPICM17_70039 [Lactococcus piscium]